MRRDQLTDAQLADIESRLRAVDRACVASFVRVMVVVVSLLVVCTVALAAPKQTTWQRLNDECIGAPDKNPACKRRDALSQQYLSQGWLQGRHDVWVSPAKIVAFTKILVTYDIQLQSNLFAADSILPVAMQTLRSNLNDDELFAVWNERKDFFRKKTPFAAILVRAGMQQLAMYLSSKNDPRYNLDD